MQDLLQALLATDPADLRRMVAALGGTVDAGQLAHLVGASPAAAAEVIAALDEVGDQRLGIEEMESENVAAALADLSGPHGTDPAG